MKLPDAPESAEQAEARRRVRLGADYLDGQLGEQWRIDIDMELFDIADEFSCILGQTFGEYINGLDELGLEDETEGIQFGFNAGNGIDFPELGIAWEMELHPEMFVPVRPDKEVKR